jgi:hypothetical protein
VVTCDCYTVGGPWVSYDPDCAEHGDDARQRNATAEAGRRAIEDETAEAIAAWMERLDRAQHPNGGRDTIQREYRERLREWIRTGVWRA